MLVITMFSGNAIGDENYKDHNADGEQSMLGLIGDTPVVPNPPCVMDPAEDRTRNKDA
ncbi:hypothetical protein [uncultured Methanolobus sp.]|uniref:hypothetical protein n=1 Tax=uncultured Methanolobus sp. TaxID=218300 RepID=UPI0029C71ABD|nr:hypothetical protein [uncultured Methanolobus sp.]